MHESLLRLLNHLAEMGGAYGAYIGVAGILLLSGLGLPLPEDIPLLAGGLLCGLGKANIYVMIPLTFTAVLGADCLLYFLGRRWGHHVPKLPLFRRYLSQERLAKSELAFHSHGGKTLFTARFLPGLRAGVFFTAGVFKIPFWKMLAFDGSAALISVPTLVLAGYFGALHFERVLHWTGQAQMALVVVILLLVGGFIAYKLMRRRQRLLISTGE